MLVERIYQWAATDPDKTALIANGQAMSYREFACAIDATLEMFAAQRLPATGTVFVPGIDRVQSWLYILALRQLGLSPLTPMPWIPLSDLEVGQPDVVLTFSRREFLKARVKHLFNGRYVARVFSSPTPRPDRQPPRKPRVGSRFGDMLLLSSGTTGRYKVLVLPGADISQTHESIASTYRLTERTVFNFHGVGPWTGMGGRVLPSVWACGGTVIFDTAKDCFSRIFQHGTNTTFFVPTDVQKVVNSPPPLDACLIFVGGGFLSERNADTLRRLPGCTTVFGYGATEASGLLMQKELRAAQDDTEHWFEPLPGRRVEVVDEQGLPCADGVEGALRLQTRRGDCVGYLGDSLNTARVYADGYIYPGDLATRSDDGRIRINGRSSDVVILRSQKISAAVIEATVRAGLGVEVACAFSGLGEHGEEELVIALELPQLPAASVLTQLEIQRPPFESVRWACLPAFPRTDTGLNKIRRNALRALLYPTRGGAAVTQPR